MPTWTEYVNNLNQLATPEQKDNYIRDEIAQSLNRISTNRNNRHVVVYASAFLQKPQAPQNLLGVMPEDINGFMAALSGQVPWRNNLTLILHTPGGSAEAAETIVDYLKSKFTDIEVIVPTYAQSAGTMIALAANNIIMGNQSQLGPIDPQMLFNQMMVPVQSIESQFKKAKQEISKNPKLAHAWAPILQHLGPALLEKAKNASKYGEIFVAECLRDRMFKGQPGATNKAKKVAKYFNSTKTHNSHGKRIDREEARRQGVSVDSLESSQELQDAVLSLYHLLSILFDQTSAAKAIMSNTGKTWLKNTPQPRIQVPQLLIHQSQLQAPTP